VVGNGGGRFFSPDLGGFGLYRPLRAAQVVHPKVTPDILTRLCEPQGTDFAVIDCQELDNEIV